MEAKDIVIEGLEDVIKRDLLLHKEILERTKGELAAYQAARSHEIQKKKHYRRQIGGGKFSDDALKGAMQDIAVNIRHMSDKVDLSQKKIEHETLIVDTLTEQLRQQEIALEVLAEYRRRNGAA